MKFTFYVEGEITLEADNEHEAREKFRALPFGRCEFDDAPNIKDLIAHKWDNVNKRDYKVSLQ